MSLSNIANPKSILAKLLAQENLIVEHKKTYTASFDPKNRILTLPIWKDMSVDIYDLLVGHEVGHAWETPPQGWHTAIEKKGKGFRSFLNVVEDARIEKKIKNRYPGLRGPFYRGYRELFDSDFFGVDESKVNSLSLIDRLNLHFKIGSLLNVPFEQHEKTYVDRMEKLDTWDDVYALAEELYTYHKENPTTDFDEFGYDEEGYEEGDEYEEGDDGEGKLGSKGSRSGDEYEPVSETDRAFRAKEATLLSDDIHPYVYANLPKVELEKAIIDFKVLYNGCDFSAWDNFHAYVSKHYASMSESMSDKVLTTFDKSRLYNEYKEKNMKFIMYLVKEFELKRNASQFMRASVSKTGELDTNKVWSYKLKEDLFKRVTKLPNGKNHGMVMYVDWSGSMSANISNTIEQTLILADFCKKVSIPFEVFAFSDNSYLSGLKYGVSDLSYRKDKFSKRNKDLAIDGRNVYLINLLSNRMSKAEYRNAQHRLLQLGAAFDPSDDDYENRYVRSLRTHTVPTYLTLHGTPLDESIILATYFIEQFKAVNKLDVANTIFLTDGDGAETRCIWENGHYRALSNEAGSKMYNAVLKDPATGIVVTCKPNEPMTVGLLKMMKAKTNTNLVGYFISTRPMKTTINYMANLYGQHVDLEEATRFSRKNKYFGLDNTGYDKYFLVLSKDLEVQESKIDVKDDFNKRELLKAFVSNQKNKVLNRILLNKFIEQIA